MVSFRQVATVIWTFLGFMVVAGLVFNLRYKQVGEGDTMYLDTWTGRIRAAVVDAPLDPAARARARASESGEIVLRERALRQLERRACGNVRFAFPAPSVESR